MTSSAVPCICSTLTGSLGAQSAGLATAAPARLATAAMRSAWSHAMRYDMNPPFECPRKYTRFESTE